MLSAVEIFGVAATPSRLLLIFSLGLLLARQDYRCRAFPLFLLFVVAGCGVEYYLYLEEIEFLLLVGAFLSALLVVSPLRIEAPFGALLAAFSGFLVGVDSTQKEFLWYEDWFGLIVSVAGACIFFWISMLLAGGLGGGKVQEVGIKAAGSWVAAISLMVLSFYFVKTS
ncbi:hypothetical protein [Pseudomonas asiatica]|uniref:hypothetical protein n=1 Tax=Pseudomonas asiatica TaxID=2219225 RepID=UPI003877C772